MRVRELIEVLQALPPDMPVLLERENVEDGCTHYRGVAEVKQTFVSSYISERGELGFPEFAVAVIE